VGGPALWLVAAQQKKAGGAKIERVSTFEQVLSCQNHYSRMLSCGNDHFATFEQAAEEW
jgi:hypothetical protein